MFKALLGNFSNKKNYHTDHTDIDKIYSFFEKMYGHGHVVPSPAVVVVGVVGVVVVVVVVVGVVVVVVVEH